MTTEDNCKLSSIEKIDFVLNYLSRAENKGANRTVDDIRIGEMNFYKRVNFYESITREDIVIIMAKLVKEKHAMIFSAFPNDMPDEIRYSTALYRITFDGLLWIEKGGYQGEVDRNNLAEQRVRVSQTLTWILAVGVVAPFAWYLLDVSRNYYNTTLRFWIYFVPFALLFGLGLFLYQYLPKKTVSKKKE